MQITKKLVDSFEPGKQVSRCQFLANFIARTGTDVIPFTCQLNLIGAKEPNKKLTITLPSSSRKRNAITSSVLFREVEPWDSP